MKPSIQLKFSQQLTMTPQLQQAIKLLQLSTFELQQEIQQALEDNPLLELSEDTADLDSVITDERSNNDVLNAETSSEDAFNKDAVPDELPLDSSWEEVYTAGIGSGPDYDFGEETIFQGETTQSLQDHLHWQINLSNFSETDLVIAEVILDSLDENGFLSLTPEDIVLAVAIDDVEIEEVACVLKRIQLLDPVGCGAANMQQCLLLQLNQYALDTPYLSEAKKIVSEYSELLANKDFRGLMRKTKLREAQLKKVLELLQQLDPKPGAAYQQSDNHYVIPDVSVLKKQGRWQVELNPDALPKINLNQQYAAMSNRAQSTQDSQFIKNHLQEAKWFLKSLSSRNETLLKVSHCIVQQQQAFFEDGPERMKPMILNDVAEMIDMHESTISRVTTNKYMHTPRGIFELKYFFSSHVQTESGGECSSTAIRAVIKKLIAAENPVKPLSDSKISQLLIEQGVNVARRTVAKYRESLMIPPSNQRKTLA